MINSIIMDKTCPNQKMMDLFNQSVNIFHCFDEDYVKLLSQVLKIYQSENENASDPEKSLKISKMILQNHLQNISKYDSKTVQLQMKVAMLCNYLKKFDDADGFIQDARKILIVAYGEDHPKVTVECKRILHNIEMNKKLQQ